MLTWLGMMLMRQPIAAKQVADLAFYRPFVVAVAQAPEPQRVEPIDPDKYFRSDRMVTALRLL